MAESGGSLKVKDIVFGEVCQRSPHHLASELLPELHKFTGLDLTAFVPRCRTCTETYTKDGKMDLLGQENRYRQFINLSNKLIILKISYLIKELSLPICLFQIRKVHLQSFLRLLTN